MHFNCLRATWDMLTSNMCAVVHYASLMLMWLILRMVFDWTGFRHKVDIVTLHFGSVLVHYAGESGSMHWSCVYLYAVRYHFITVSFILGPWQTYNVSNTTLRKDKCGIALFENNLFQNFQRGSLQYDKYNGRPIVRPLRMQVNH